MATILTNEEREELALILGVPREHLFISEPEFLALSGYRPEFLEWWLNDSWNQHNIGAVLAGDEEAGSQPWALVNKETDTIRLFSPLRAALLADAEREISIAQQYLKPGHEPSSACQLIDWWDFVAYMRKRFMMGCRLWREEDLWHGARRQEKHAALNCVAELEKRIPVLSSRHPWHMAEQLSTIQKCLVLMSKIAGYLGDAERVKRFTKVLIQAPERWAAYLEATIDSQWLDSRKPIRYLTKVTATKYHNEVRPDISIGLDSQKIEHRPGHGGKCKPSDALGRAHLSLEEIAEAPDEALLERRFTERSVSELQKAAEGNPLLGEYVRALIENPRWKRPDIWNSLGWSENKGKAVDRQYRRLRKRMKVLGAGMEWRTVPKPGISEGSQFTYFEVLADGTRGRAFGLLQHKPLETEEE